jgi:hypothetical protein
MAYLIQFIIVFLALAHDVNALNMQHSFRGSQFQAPVPPPAEGEETEAPPLLPCNWTTNTYGVAVPLQCNYWSTNNVQKNGVIKLTDFYHCVPYEVPEPVEPEESEEGEGEVDEASEDDPNADNAAGIEEAAVVPPPPEPDLINPKGWPQDCKAPMLNSCRI